MRRRIAHGLALACLFASLGAAQGPNISEAKPAPGSSTQSKIRSPQAGRQDETVSDWDSVVVWRVFSGKTHRQRRTVRNVRHDRRPPHASPGKPTCGSRTCAMARPWWSGSTTADRSFRGGLSTCRMVLPRRCSSGTRGLQRVRLDLVKPRASRRPAYQTVAVNHPPVAELP